MRAAPLALAATAIAGAARAAPSKEVPGPKDKVVLQMDSEALGKDYLNTEFIKAEKRLEKAIDVCGKKACSTRVLARLHRDLAVVYVAGLSKLDDGKRELHAAHELDPDFELDPDYVTPELKKAYDQVRGVKAKPEPRPAKKKAAGFEHTAVTEQAIATPIPLLARFNGSDGAKVKLWYRPVGAERWSSLDMTNGAAGFTAEIPCNASARAGEVAYFLEALGENDETLDKDGSRTEPHVVAIVKELQGDPPHLPDAAAPDKCKDVCTGSDCEGQEANAKRPRNNWIVLAVEQDLAIVGAATGVCSPDVQVFGSYSCFRSTGSQYLGDPLADPADNVNTGIALGTTRVRIGYDRVLVAGLVLGLRVGVVVHGLGPRADGASVHAPLYADLEGRLAYWFGSDVFSTSGVRPFIFAGGGLAQVDAHFGVVVHETPGVPPPPAQTNNPPSQSLDAYRRMGQAFVGGGAGLMYAFTPGIGLALDLKYMHLLPTSGNALSPELSLGFGF